MIDLERRLLVLTPTGRDAELARSVLAKHGVLSEEVALESLREKLDMGVGALLIAEEAFGNGAGPVLAQAISSQPAWSDVPLIVLTGQGANSAAASNALRTLGNVSLLERPVRIAALVSCVKTALRARERQYLLREYLLERERADRRKDEFLATLAHELRNPLAPIRNALEVLRRAGSDPAITHRMAAMMERQVDLMVRLVDDLLELSRITRGAIELRKERVDVGTILQRALETSRPLVEAAHHRLAVERPEEPLVVDVDPVRLAQVFSNLINNAAKYTDDGGEISIAARRLEASAVVSVRDNGAGIPEDMLARVFEMFTQLRQGPAAGPHGLGVGLTIARTLVEMHGGRIEARSEGAGRGSEFVVTLPLAAEASVPVTEEPIHARPGLLGKRILIADDHPESADSLSLILEMHGADARTAHGGQETLELFESFRPSVALLDIGMPGLNGYEVARRIRKAPGGGSVSLIALTGWGQPDDRRRSSEAGFDRHIVKPPDLDKLLDLLESLPA